MKIKNGFVLEQVGDSYLAIATGPLAASFKALVKLNETGAFLWKCLDGKDIGIDALVEKMVENYGIDAGLARSDAEKFVENLTNVGILEA